MGKAIYKIHPAIGVTRVGNAPRDKFFLGSEFPGFGATEAPLVNEYKSGGLIRPQGARFRIFEYIENKNGHWEPKREITLADKDCIDIRWKAHLVNKKASFFKFTYYMGLTGSPDERRNKFINARRTLEIDPLARTISGARKGPVEFRKGTSSNPARELWVTPAPTPDIDYLGELRTDDAGRLIVIGGRGIAGAWPTGRPITATAAADPFNIDGWFDDVSDGPITAEVVMRGDDKKQQTFMAEGAWVLCGPPDFAPGLKNVVTLYDVLFNMAAREMTLDAANALFDSVLKPLWDINADFRANSGAKLTSYKPDFDWDIYPILLSALHAIYTFEPLAARHTTFYVKGMAALGDPDPAQKPMRDMIFGFFRKPGVVGRAPTKMPKLHGDEWSDPASAHMGLSVTRTQYAMLERWRDGQFGKTGGKYPPDRPSWMNDITPHGLDLAALENCVGGAMAPGIEASWQIRDPRLFIDPFRIKHGAPTRYRGDVGAIGPGHFSRQMALPWHTDFRACAIYQDYGWWPAQRPDIVYPSKQDFLDRFKAPVKHKNWTRANAGNWPSGSPIPSSEEFIEHYFKFGFVLEDPKDFFVERERNTSVP
jgi:hypothetical protein